MWESLRKNWLTIVLLVLVVTLLVRQMPGAMVQRNGFSGGGVAKVSSLGIAPSSMMFDEAAPVVQENRLVVRNTNLSLKVNDVRRIVDEIALKASQFGGFLVSSSLNVPDGPATGQVDIRVLSDKLPEALKAIRALGVKVISESVMGTDVTSEYVDLTARLETLLKTKVKFEKIMESATQVGDLLNVQRELINLQSQIDSLRGQQKYLEQTAKLSLITVYLGTDELALPYAPDESWRPTVVFKQAVRSLVKSIRELGTVLIWVFVYIPVWGVGLLAIWWYKRRLQT